jgi:hypothetical protein
MRYTLYALAILATYGVIEWRGINLLPTSQKEPVPASVRNSPGGYRNFTSYYGFHGGK